MTDNHLDEYKDKTYFSLKQVNDASIESSLEFGLEKISLDNKSAKNLVVISKVKRILDPDSEKHLPSTTFSIPLLSVRSASDFKKEENMEKKKLKNQI